MNLDDALLAEARQVAARTGRSLSAVVEDALRQSLYRRDPTTRQTIELPVFGEGGTQPGVDLDDSAALLELMEQDDSVADDAAR
jgi:plasmid stability protein